MKRFLPFLFAVSILAGFASAEAPVTQAEAATVFTKAEQVMKSVLRYKTAAPAFQRGTGVATREQILKHFSDLMAAMKGKFKFTPPPLPSAPAYVSFKDPKTKELAVKMEALGFIDRYGPLATSKTEGLSPQEFGDALGYFMARIAELSHTPSSKFSPYLSG
ncbi:MAG TPA: hypothetical protein VHE55_16525 [Fimbriimonadaceae bacterium]|nr:hypothetical protein [Fimbriimonadaceae bacterium]